MTSTVQTFPTSPTRPSRLHRPPDLPEPTPRPSLPNGPGGEGVRQLLEQSRELVVSVWNNGGHVKIVSWKQYFEECFSSIRREVFCHEYTHTPRVLSCTAHGALPPGISLVEFLAARLSTWHRPGLPSPEARQWFLHMKGKIVCVSFECDLTHAAQVIGCFKKSTEKNVYMVWEDGSAQGPLSWARFLQSFRRTDPVSGKVLCASGYGPVPPGISLSECTALDLTPWNFRASPCSHIVCEALSQPPEVCLAGCPPF